MRSQKLFYIPLIVLTLLGSSRSQHTASLWPQLEIAESTGGIYTEYSLTGENALLFSNLTLINFTCRADYPIRFENNLEVVESNSFPNEVECVMKPETGLQNTTCVLSIQIKLHPKKSGYVECRPLHFTHKSTTLWIFGNERAVDTTQITESDKEPKEGDLKCPEYSKDSHYSEFIWYNLSGKAGWAGGYKVSGKPFQLCESHAKMIPLIGIVLESPEAETRCVVCHNKQKAFVYVFSREYNITEPTTRATINATVSSITSETTLLTVIVLPNGNPTHGYPPLGKPNSTTTPPTTNRARSSTEETTTSKGETEESKPGTSNESIITIAVLILTVLLIVCLYFGLRHLHHKKNFRKLTQEEINEFRKGKYRQSFIQNSVLLGLSEKLMAPFENEVSQGDTIIGIEKQLEKDDFLSVHPAIVNGRLAIVKVTDCNKTNVMFFKDFLKDIKIMDQLSPNCHANIVQFFGAITSDIDNRVVCAFFETSALGDVKYFLRSNSLSWGIAEEKEVNQCIEMTSKQAVSEQFTALRLFNWSRQIASGMDYLQMNQVVHGDLNASHVYLFPENHVKISDAASSRKNYERNYYLANFKPPPKWRWMAIELFRSKKFTTKTDVWAFGATIWEIFSLGKDPHTDIKWCPKFVEKLENGYRMEKPLLASDELYQILLRCWYRYPNDRSDFIQIKQLMSDCISSFPS